MNFGIIGAGEIARTMAFTIMQMPETSMYAIASRDMKKAKQYQKQYHIKKAYDSYEKLAADPDVDVVYIATPHSFHYEQTKMCLEHGKHVLCEKAFTANEKQARDLIDIAEKKGLFLGEAMWTRFMPLVKKLQQLLKEKVIGEVTMVTANLNFPMLYKERLVKAELAGGALLDVGIYPLTIASLVMGDDISKIRATGILNENGVDQFGQYTIVYQNGTMADLNAGMCSFSDGKAVIYGTKGFIVVEGINRPESILVLNEQGNISQQFHREKQITGYEYEVQACINAIIEGKTECDEIAHEQTLRMMHVMDDIRKQMGVKYPFEK